MTCPDSRAWINTYALFPILKYLPAFLTHKEDSRLNLYASTGQQIPNVLRGFFLNIRHKKIEEQAVSGSPVPYTTYSSFQPLRKEEITLSQQLLSPTCTYDKNPVEGIKKRSRV